MSEFSESTLSIESFDPQEREAVLLASDIVAMAIDKEWDMEIFNDPTGVKLKNLLHTNEIERSVMHGKYSLPSEIETALSLQESFDAYNWAISIVGRLVNEVIDDAEEQASLIGQAVSSLNVRENVVESRFGGNKENSGLEDIKELKKFSEYLSESFS